MRVFTDMQVLGTLVTAFLVCAALGPVLIPVLHRLKFGQSIREVGPASHQKKSGTPTMGGIMILAGILVSVLLWDRLTPIVVIALVLTLGHAIIGFIDDYIKVVKKRNLGLTAKQKFAMQTVLALCYIYYVEVHAGPWATLLWIPGTQRIIPVGLAYYVLAFFLLVGTTNAVNLTDGLDGLVSCVTLPVMLSYALIALLAGAADLSLFAVAVVGALLGFLIWNHHPAKVFMGDTGSLALGGAVAAMALLTHTELLLIVLGGVYVCEALSVIIQVTYFRRTGGKRFFRMTPIHHHFELGGWKETKVVAVFTVASVVCCLLALALFFEYIWG
ncbi:MAG: phospho-N-acetylmuramoyl-pentapeptide-transferase [Succiniclasticum sp.]|jgi:phospho-N-acetylmuramoyl-pentapeptide-transferase